jgi:geranylgeranyl pyrophosphate synthase
MSFDLDSYLAALREHVNAALQERLPPREKEDPLRLREAMAGAVLEGGKRLRPCLTLAACHAVGGTTEQALAPACAVEFLHAYSLIHDDLPAMDNDTTRRGKPTCHVRFGETAAILAGDALLTLAFEVLAAEGQHPERALPMIKASYELSRAAGARGMVGGQAMDMRLKSAPPSFEVLELCHSGKTAALFSASAAMGALAARGAEDQVDLLRTFGFDLGLAFQHADDLMDAEFPVHREQAHRRVLELSRRAARSVERLGSAGSPLVAFSRWVEQRAEQAVSHEPAPSNQ